MNLLKDIYNNPKKEITMNKSQLWNSAQKIVMLMEKKWRSSPIEVVEQALEHLDATQLEEEAIVSLIDRALLNRGELKYNK